MGNPLKCTSCETTFETVQGLKTHLDENSGQCQEKSVSYSCEKCNALWYDAHKFKLHNLEKHGDPYDCGICHKIFTDTSTLSKHVHESKCMKCNQAFTSENELNIHDCSNLDSKDELEVPLVCQQCDLTFKNKSGLNYHLTKHFAPSLVCGKVLKLASFQASIQQR